MDEWMKKKESFVPEGKTRKIQNEKVESDWHFDHATNTQNYNF